MNTFDKICEYIERGYNVFPLTPGAKVPLAAALDGGSQNSTIHKPIDEDGWEELLKKYPDANIGVHTGEPSGFVVIDIDCAKNGDTNKRTPDQAKILCDEFVDLFGETLVHKTTSGGYHLFYRYDGTTRGLGRRINAFKQNKTLTVTDIFDKEHTLDLSDIDVLGGDGYVVFPPSSTELGNYEIVHDYTSDGLNEFPTKLLELLTPKTKKNADILSYISYKNGGVLPVISDKNSKEMKVLRAWEKVGSSALKIKLKQYTRAGEGERHDSLLKTAATVFAMLPYKEWDNAKTYVDEVVRTFNPPYNKKDEGEILNAILWAKAQEYASRTSISKEDEKVRDAQVTAESIEVGVAKDVYEDELNNCEKELLLDEKGKFVLNEHNISIIFTMHPKYRRQCSYDTFTESYRYKNATVDITSKDDSAMLSLLSDIQKSYFPKASLAAIKTGFAMSAQKNSKDSYKEYMDSLIGTWDKVPRMHFWLQKVYGCEDDAYHRAVSGNFIFGMVRRAYEPGANFPYTLFLRGEQGTGKSRAMKILGSVDKEAGERYLEFKDSIEGREFYLHAKGMAVIDFAEGESMHKSSQKLIKALITDQSGTHRDFASGNVSKHPPRYVLAITNNNSPLIDPTGGRRYLVIDIELPYKVCGDTTWLKVFRKQILAEAVEHYHEMNAIESKLLVDIESPNTELVYSATKELESIRLQEINEDALGVDAEDVEALSKALMTPYGIINIPAIAADNKRDATYMHSPIEMSVKEVLMSYDEYRARSPDFVISANDIERQIDNETKRASRTGSYILNEIGFILKRDEYGLDKYRIRSGDNKNRRGWQIKHPAINHAQRLAAIRSIRRTQIPAIEMSLHDRVYIKDYERAEIIRQKREGGAFCPISNEAIVLAMKKGAESFSPSDMSLMENEY